MSESSELYASVNYIKHKVDVLEKIELLNLHSNKTLFEEYKRELSDDEMLFKIYCSIDGKKAQKDIASDVDTTSMTVSNKIKKLETLGLIELKTVVGNNKIYKHSIAETAFGLTRGKCNG